MERLRETPWGPIHLPPANGVLWATFVAALIGGPLTGWLLARAAGVTGDGGYFVCVAPFLFTFVAGYALWLSRLQALAFELFGRGLLKFLWQWFRQRQLPADARGALPDEQQVLRFAVQVQRAASSFLIVAVPVFLFAALCALLVDARWSALSLAGALLVLGISYGGILFRLGRRARLRVPEDEG